jgi:hypothetical protein
MFSSFFCTCLEQYLVLPPYVFNSLFIVVENAQDWVVTLKKKAGITGFTGETYEKENNHQDDHHLRDFIYIGYCQPKRGGQAKPGGFLVQGHGTKMLVRRY